ncbi:hypothetical protein ACI2K4_11565 [Micromonospora sp. NPDC050397]|uniref:hypothetical protein n=1 Tax=Micromonospora sp. NPDC050397 TaxID=3364279 RepID=UPI0038516BE2
MNARVDDTYAELLDALADGDMRPLRKWLGEHLLTPESPCAEADLRLLDRLAFWNADDHNRDAQGLVTTALERALEAAAPVPYGGPLLLLYLKFRCDQAWQAAWDIDLIVTVMGFARRSGARLVAAGRCADPELTRLALDLLGVLISEIATFNAASCGSLAAWARMSGDTRDLARAVAQGAEAVGPSAIAEHLAVQARRDESYYASLARAAQAVHDHFEYGGSDLVGAAQALRAAEEGRPDDCERSELRAHRHNVEALAEVAEEPWVRIDHAKLVYLYPFGLYGSTGPVRPAHAVPEQGTSTFSQHMVEVARRTAEEWTVAGWSIAEHPQAMVTRDLLLDDIWKGDDPLGRQYRGMAVTLPDLELADIDRPDAEPTVLKVELRLSELGNHYLRLECDLVGATPQQVYAAMIRPVPEYGDLVELGSPLRSATPGPADRVWPRLANFATDVIRDVTEHLADRSGLAVRRSGRPGMYHVMVSVERGSLVPPDGAEPVPVALARDAATAVGAQPLVHPIRNGINSMAEWLRYRVEPGALPIVDAPAFAGDLLLRTCNTTLMVVPGTPDYAANMVLETAEFVATLEGMFAGWQDQIAEHYDQVMAQLSTMVERLERRDATADPDGTDPAEYERVTQELADMQGGLEAQQLRLHQFVMASRLSLMFVTAPSLVMSPVVRLTIDRLLAAAKFDALRGEFEGMIDDVLGDRIGALVDASVRRQRERNDALARTLREREAYAAQAEREQREREERARQAREREEAERQERRDKANRHWNDVLLGAIATVGLSGLMQIIQAGYNVERLYATGLVAIVVLLATVVGWGLHRIQRDAVPNRRSRRPRKRRANTTTAGVVGGTRE